jgi:hypothetical protein
LKNGLSISKPIGCVKIKKDAWSDQKERKIRRRERRKKKQLKRESISKGKANEPYSNVGQEIEDWTNEARLLKRLKAGKITEEQFEEALENGSP